MEKLSMSETSKNDEKAVEPGECGEPASVTAGPSGDDAASPVALTPKKRGRPKGSKNKVGPEIAAVTSEKATGTTETRDPSVLTLHSQHLRIPHDPISFLRLKESIEVYGIRNPLHILPDNTVLAGRDRRQVALDLKLGEVPVTVRYDLDGDEDAQLAFLIDDNLNQKTFPEPILVELIDLKHGAEERAAAKRRKAEATKYKGTGGPPPEDPRGNVSTTGKSRDNLGKLAGVSGKQFEKILALVHGYRNKDQESEKSIPIAQLYVEGQVISASRAESASKLPRDVQRNIVATVVLGATAQEDRKRLAHDAIKAALDYIKQPKPKPVKDTKKDENEKALDAALAGEADSDETAKSGEVKPSGTPPKPAEPPPRTPGSHSDDGIICPDTGEALPGAGKIVVARIKAALLALENEVDNVAAVEASDEGFGLSHSEELGLSLRLDDARDTLAEYSVMICNLAVPEKDDDDDDNLAA